METEKGYIPFDSKAAWVVADNMVVVQKVKHALSELDAIPTSTTSSNEKKRNITPHSSTNTSSTIISASNQKRDEFKEEYEDVFIENKNSTKKKPKETLDKARKNSTILSINRDITSSRKHEEGCEGDEAYICTSLYFPLDQNHNNHTERFEISHIMTPVDKNQPNGRANHNK